MFQRASPLEKVFLILQGESQRWEVEKWRNSAWTYFFLHSKWLYCIGLEWHDLNFEREDPQISLVLLIQMFWSWDILFCIFSTIYLVCQHWSIKYWKLKTGPLLMDHWSIGPLDHWTIGPLVHWTIGPLVHLSERTSGVPLVMFSSNTI